MEKHNSSLYLDFPATLLRQVSYLNPALRAGSDSNFYWNKGEEGWVGKKSHCWEHRERRSTTHLCLANSVRLGQPPMEPSLSRVTRLDTCNCTASYLNKDCGGLPTTHTHTVNHTHTHIDNITSNTTRKHNCRSLVSLSSLYTNHKYSRTLCGRPFASLFAFYCSHDQITIQ